MRLEQEPTARPVSAPKGRWGEYTQLSRQIKQAGLLERRRGWYAARIGLNLALLAAGWAAFAVLGESWWQLVTAAYLAVVFTQLAFVGHDAGHRQVFRSRRANDRVGLLHANLLVGVSFDWWVGKHNRHHTNPNHEDLDPDISITALAFTDEQASSKNGLVRLVARYQAWLFFPLLLLEAAHLHLASIKAIVRGSGRANLVEGLLLAHPSRRLSDRAGPGAVAAAGGGVRRGPAGPVRAVPGLLVRPQPQGHADPHRRRPAGLRPPPGADLPQRAPAAGWWTSCWAGSTTRSSTTCSRTCPGPTCATPSRWCGRSARRHGLAYVEASLVGSYVEAVRHLHAVGAPLRPAVAE